jgi:circadian clock protein KaiC
LGSGVALPTDQVKIVCRSGVDLDPDRVAWELWRKAEEMRATRVVIDDSRQLERELGPDRIHGYFASLLGRLRALGATTCITRDRVGIPSREQAGDALSLASVVDNIVVLGTAEQGRQRHRLMTVVKMRNSDHDLSACEYRIGRGGFGFLGSQSAEGS